MDPLAKLSVNVPLSCARKLRSIRYHHGLSTSSVVEAALRAFFARKSDEQIARRARKVGATLRRQSSADAESA